MANIDSYNSPVDWRITRNPAPVEGKAEQQNFKDIYDFSFAVISTLVQMGVGGYDPSLYPQLRLRPTQFIAQAKNRVYSQAAIPITAGQFVRFTTGAGGIATVTPAIANLMGGKADGFANSSGAAGSVVEVILGDGINPFLVGPLAPGTRYWLSPTVAGGVQTTIPATAGQIYQSLGTAIDLANMYVRIGSPVQL